MICGEVLGGAWKTLSSSGSHSLAGACCLCFSSDSSGENCVGLNLSLAGLSSVKYSIVWIDYYTVWLSALK